MGVAKKLYHVDGIRKGPEHKEKVYVHVLNKITIKMMTFTLHLAYTNQQCFLVEASSRY